MERYKIIKTVGDGTYGTVFKATNTSNGETVAIKKMKTKFKNWEECLSLREIKSLRKLSHANIVKLKEAFRVNDDLHLVFEFLDRNLYQLIKDETEPLPENKLRSIIQQILLGLEYMHKHGFFHRDLKLENIMISNDICKITDFGLAREIRSKPPFTDYVSTRWYRAPEILLRGTSYNSPVDIFALGCIMAELYMLKPLAAGNNEIDQLLKLCSILGTPSLSAWPEGYKLASQMNYRFPQFQPVSFETLIPHASHDAVNLISRMLAWDPQKRPTASDCLKHPYFSFNVSIVVLEAPPVEGNEPYRTGSKWSIGSSRINGDSSKGKWALKNVGEKKESALPKLKENGDFQKLQGFKSEPLRNNEGLSLPPMMNLQKPGIGMPLLSREKQGYMNDRLSSGYERQPSGNRANYYKLKYANNTTTVNAMMPKSLPPIGHMGLIGGKIMGRHHGLGLLRY